MSEHGSNAHVKTRRCSSNEYREPFDYGDDNSRRGEGKSGRESKSNGESKTDRDGRRPGGRRNVSAGRASHNTQGKRCPMHEFIEPPVMERGYVVARVSAWYTLFRLSRKSRESYGMAHGHRQSTHIQISMSMPWDTVALAFIMVLTGVHWFDAYVLPSSCHLVAKMFCFLCCLALLGDALTEKIVEMHESCANGGEGGAGASPGEGNVEGLGTSATPKEYVSFLRSWFTMHESKKVSVLSNFSYEYSYFLSDSAARGRKKFLYNELPVHLRATKHPRVTAQGIVLRFPMPLQYVTNCYQVRSSCRQSA